MSRSVDDSLQLLVPVMMLFVIGVLAVAISQVLD
jgi:hypothetical protein